MKIRYDNATNNQCDWVFYYGQDCSGDKDRGLGYFGGGSRGLGCSVDYLEANPDIADLTGEFYDFGSIYLRNQCRTDNADGADCAWFWSQKLRNSFVGSRGFGTFERSFGEIEVKNRNFQV